MRTNVIAGVMAACVFGTSGCMSVIFPPHSNSHEVKDEHVTVRMLSKKVAEDLVQIADLKGDPKNAVNATQQAALKAHRGDATLNAHEAAVLEAYQLYQKKESLRPAALPAFALALLGPAAGALTKAGLDFVKACIRRGANLIGSAAHVGSGPGAAS
jgi:esterase/lipase superfamily enzyme